MAELAAGPQRRLGLGCRLLFKPNTITSPGGGALGSDPLDVIVTSAYRTAPVKHKPFRSYFLLAEGVPLTIKRFFG